jgi:protein TonB
MQTRDGLLGFTVTHRYGRPIYPEEARGAHVQGTVTLRCLIGFDGSVERIDVEEGDELLVPAATKAISQLRYKPLFLNGQAVQTETSITVVFQLPKRQQKEN